MKLHRLVLTNYRGVQHREIVFPDHGVVVVSGANEIGKSSMIEALDLLMEAKDRSTKREVKQVKPTHADVGAEITAEISTGRYRFVYRKRFHKKTETELSLLAPVAEQLTGDEAHERVCAMLAETVDSQLWRAQRVLQACSTEAVDLSGCDALSRALDICAGHTATLSGEESLLVERIDIEYGRYFTATGRPTGEWSAAIARLSAADDEVARCAAAVADVDADLHLHAELTTRLSEVREAYTVAGQRLASAQAGADAAAALTAQLKEARLVAAATEAAAAASVAAHKARRQLRDDVDGRAAAVAELEDAARAAAEEELSAREVDEAAAVLVEQSDAAVRDAQARVDAARRAADQLSDRDEAGRLASRLARIDAAQLELDRVDNALAAMVLTDESMAAIETAATAVERATGQVDRTSARMELTAAVNIELVIDGQRLGLAAGESYSTKATGPTRVELPGVLSMRIAPGTPASDNQAKLLAAQEQLGIALAAGQAGDVDDARARYRQRRELGSARDRLAATLVGLFGDEPVAALRDRLGVLRDRACDDELIGHTDSAAARAELDAAVAAHRQAGADREKHRAVAAAARSKYVEASARAVVLAEKLTGAHAELDQAGRRLAAERQERSDDEITRRCTADADAAQLAAGRAAELGAELAQALPERAAAVRNEAIRYADELNRRQRQLENDVRDVTTRLQVYGSEGRRGRLDAAQGERAQAASEHLRVGRRARAAQTLRSVMARHRDDTRLRYVEPFRAEIQRLGRLVFGDSFEVHIDTELRICSRTLGGRTVPYESLSGGAKEQLAIVARLAGAALVAKDDAVPVIIDDALGFSDADRLAKMGAAFNAVGCEGQVIVLTCSPARYDSVDGAYHIALTA